MALNLSSMASVLEQRRQSDLYRQRAIMQSPQGVDIMLNQQSLLNFCSNDYLGLANEPRVIEALKQGAELNGAGSGSAHLVNGHFQVHHDLEKALAEFTGRESALLFSSGYMANMGAISALLQRGDAVFEDRLNHASLLDGGLLSGARFSRYPHNDVQALQKQLDNNRSENRLVVSDGVFSMDGDLSDIKQLATVCQSHGAWLMIDDAHGLGVLGENGGGCLELAGLDQSAVPVLVGTLGKAFGTFGAFVAGSKTLIDYLIQFARTYVYTTAVPPALAQATLISLKIIKDEPQRRLHLQQIIKHFRQSARKAGLPLSDSITPIQPLITGDAAAAMALSQALKNQGILVTAIRPPTVPQDQARLRITLSAAHTPQQVDHLVDVLAATW